MQATIRSRTISPEAEASDLAVDRGVSEAASVIDPTPLSRCPGLSLMGIDHTRDKAVWQLIGRGRDRVPDAARALQVRSYLVAALEHPLVVSTSRDQASLSEGQTLRESSSFGRDSRTVSAVILMRKSYPV